MNKNLKQNKKLQVYTTKPTQPFAHNQIISGSDAFTSRENNKLINIKNK